MGRPQRAPSRRWPKPLADSGAILAIDLGSVRVGVAACDPSRILAYPVATLPMSEDLPQRVAALMEEHRAVALVVGYPLALDGRAGIAAGNVERQARLLAAGIEQPVWLVDERLTTAEAGRRLRASGRSAKAARGVIDAQAAVGILESVLRALDRGATIGRRLEMEEAHGETR